MDKELKAKWVAALRSGEFKQCQSGNYYESGSYCCLGVAAAVALDKRGEEIMTRLPRGMMIRESLEGFGIDVVAHCRLVEMNDHECKSFGEIADYIEANL